MGLPAVYLRQPAAGAQASVTVETAQDESIWDIAARLQRPHARQLVADFLVAQRRHLETSLCGPRVLTTVIQTYLSNVPPA